MRFEFFMEIAFQVGQIPWGFISQCEIWHVYVYLLAKTLIHIYK